VDDPGGSTRRADALARVGRPEAPATDGDRRHVYARDVGEFSVAAPPRVVSVGPGGGATAGAADSHVTGLAGLCER